MARVAQDSHLALNLDVVEGSRSRRVAVALVQAIADGQLADGDRVPSTRVLATSLGMSRSVVVTAFEELTASGFLVSRPGGVTTVEQGAGRAARAGAFAVSETTADGLPEPVSPPTTRQDILYDLTPGLPDPSLINSRDWNRAWRNASRQMISVAPESQGAGGGEMSRLQSLVADHVRRHRGVICSDDDVVIFPGVASALEVLSPLLLRGDATVAFEDPGYGKARLALRRAGLAVRPVPVDDEGIRADLLEPRDDAVYITPAHQYPLGARMSADRRAELLEWACASGTLIIEDDYDGEFRYDVPPMPAVRAMKRAADHVVYLGTTSKVLTRDLRIAWAVVPGRFREAIRSAYGDGSHAVGAIGATALSEFITSGALVRQIVRAHRTYAARRARFTDACRDLLGDVEQRGVDAGLHVVLCLADDRDDVDVARRLRTRGLACVPLSLTYADPDRRSSSGLICGYALLPESRARAAAELIGEVLDSPSTTKPPN